MTRIIQEDRPETLERIRELESERDEAVMLGNLLLDRMCGYRVTCAYDCGHEWETEGSPEPGAIEHSKVCPKHPMRELERRLSESEARERRMREALRFDQPWPVSEILRKLADTADHLHHAHDCDTHGWEDAHTAARLAREVIAALTSPAPVTETAPDLIPRADVLRMLEAQPFAPGTKVGVRQRWVLDSLRAKVTAWPKDAAEVPFAVTETAARAPEPEDAHEHLPGCSEIKGSGVWACSVGCGVLDEALRAATARVEAVSPYLANVPYAMPLGRPAEAKGTRFPECCSECEAPVGWGHASGCSRVSAAPAETSTRAPTIYCEDEVKCPKRAIHPPSECAAETSTRAEEAREFWRGVLPKLRRPLTDCSVVCRAATTSGLVCEEGSCRPTPTETAGAPKAGSRVVAHFVRPEKKEGEP